MVKCALYAQLNVILSSGAFGGLTLTGCGYQPDRLHASCRRQVKAHSTVMGCCSCPGLSTLAAAARRYTQQLSVSMEGLPKSAVMNVQTLGVWGLSTKITSRTLPSGLLRFPELHMNLHYTFAMPG